ncbi:hypothetical protein CsSME_00007319 [Camellia sinensis var. sinensis]
MLVTDHIPSINCFRYSRGRGPAEVAPSMCMHSQLLQKGWHSRISLYGLGPFWVQSKDQILRLSPAQHRDWTNLSTTSWA